MQTVIIHKKNYKLLPNADWIENGIIMGAGIGMVKGVNQCVVEINATENAYFDKAILFVNPGKLAEEEETLKKEGELYFASISGKSVRRKRKISGLVSSVVKVAAGAGIGAAAAAFLIRWQVLY